MKFIQALFISLLICLSLGKTFNGYLINYDQTGNIKPVKQEDVYSSSDFSALLKNNFATLTETPKSEKTQKLIKKFGKGDLLNPVEMNYLVLIEGIDKKYHMHINKQPIELELNNISQTRLLDEIYDPNNQNSLINLVGEFFRSEESRIPFYFYSSETIAEKYFEFFGITLKTNSDDSWQFYDMQQKQTIGNSFSPVSCLKEVLNGKYSFNKEQGFIQKEGTQKQFKINKENQGKMNQFAKDICGIGKLSTMFVSGNQPNFITFYLKSISELKQNVNNQDYEFLLDMMKYVVNQSVKNFSSAFGTEQTYGEVVFLEENDLQYLSSNEIIINSRRILLETSKKQRMLIQNDGENPTPSNPTLTSSLLKAWFTVFFMIVLFFICASIFSLEIQKDTLLYAKFLTTDQQAR